MDKREEAPAPAYGEQTEEMPVKPGRELEHLGDPENLNVGRPGPKVPEEETRPEPPRLPPDAPTPAAGTGTSREISAGPPPAQATGARRHP